MRISIVGYLCALTIGYHSLMAGSNPAITQDEDTSRWGFAAAIFNIDSGGLAVSRNLSRTTMLLFSVGSGWTDIDRQLLNETDKKTTIYSLNAGPEIRRIYYRHPSIGFYAGLQPTIGYTLRKHKEAMSDTDDRHRILSYGLNLTLGAEYEIIKNLSVSVHFRPIGYVYSELKVRDASQGESELITVSHTVNVSTKTGLYLRIYF